MRSEVNIRYNNRIQRYNVIASVNSLRIRYDEENRQRRVKFYRTVMLHLSDGNA